MAVVPATGVDLIRLALRATGRARMTAAGTSMLPPSRPAAS